MRQAFIPVNSSSTNDTLKLFGFVVGLGVVSFAGYKIYTRIQQRIDDIAGCFSEQGFQNQRDNVAVASMGAAWRLVRCPLFYTFFVKVMSTSWKCNWHVIVAFPQIGKLSTYSANGTHHDLFFWKKTLLQIACQTGWMVHTHTHTLMTSNIISLTALAPNGPPGQNLSFQRERSDRLREVFLIITQLHQILPFVIVVLIIV